MSCCCFCGKDVLQVANQVTFPYIDSKALDLTTIAFNAQKYDSLLMDELAAHTLRGDFIGSNKFYYNGAKGIWNRGISKIVYSSKRIDENTIPIEFANDFRPIFGEDQFADSIITNIAISKPSWLDWLISNRDNINFPNTEPQEITQHLQSGGSNITDAVYNQSKEITLKLNGVSKAIKYHSENGNTITVTSGSELITFNKPTQEQYYVISYVNDYDDREDEVHKTLILKYDGRFTYLEKYNVKENKTNLTAFPIIPMLEDGNFLSLAKYPKWQSVEGSNRGHTMVPSHLRRKYVQDHFTKDQIASDDARKSMLKQIGIDENAIMEQYMDGIKFQQVSKKDNDAFKNRLDEYNLLEKAKDDDFEDISEREMLISMTNYLKVTYKILCYDLPEDQELEFMHKVDLGGGSYKFVFNEPTDAQKESYYKYNASDKEDLIENKKKYDFFVDYISLNDPKDSLDNVSSIFISFGLKLQTENQLMLKAIHKSFIKINAYFKDDQGNGHIFNYEEGKYNKAISFDSMIIIKAQGLDAGGLTLPDHLINHYSYKIDGSDYIISEYSRESVKDEWNLSQITVKDFKTASVVIGKGMSKAVTVAIDDEGSIDKIAIPLIKEVFDEFSAVEKTTLSKYAIYMETFSAQKTYLKWYQTPSFMKLIQIAFTIYEIVTFVATLGASSSTHALTEAMKQALIKYLIKLAVIEIISELPEGDLRDAAIALYAIYEITQLQDINFDNGFAEAASYTNTLSSMYKFSQELDLRDMQEEYDLENESIQKEIKEMKEDMEIYKSHYLDTEVLDMPKAEYPNDFYNRALSTPLLNNFDIDEWYDSKLSNF